MGLFGNPLPFLLMMAAVMLAYAIHRTNSFPIQTLLVVGALVLVVVALKFFWPRNSEDDW